MSLPDPFSHLKDPRVGQISIPKTNGTKLRLECVAQIITPPHLVVRFLPGQLPVDEIDVNEKCLLYIDTGGFNLTLTTSIDKMENSQELKLVNIESISHDQKRDFFRINAQMAVDLQLDFPQQPSPLVGESINISGNGILVSFAESFAVDQRVRLNINLKDSETQGIECTARVVRIDRKKRSGYEVAFRFETIEEEDQDKIIAFCLDQQRKQLRLRVKVLGPAK